MYKVIVFNSCGEDRMSYLTKSFIPGVLFVALVLPGCDGTKPIDNIKISEDALSSHLCGTAITAAWFVRTERVDTFAIRSGESYAAGVDDLQVPMDHIFVQGPKGSIDETAATNAVAVHCETGEVTGSTGLGFGDDITQYQRSKSSEDHGVQVVKFNNASGDGEDTFTINYDMTRNVLIVRGKNLDPSSTIRLVDEYAEKDAVPTRGDFEFEAGPGGSITEFTDRMP